MIPKGEIVVNLLEFLSSKPAEVLVHGSCRKSFACSSELKKTLNCSSNIPQRREIFVVQVAVFHGKLCLFVCMSCIK